MRLIYLSIIFLISSFGFSQNEANIWYFGENAGLDFNSGAPVPLTDGQLDTIEGCATIADEDGSLLFYTDGLTVWNRTHNIMPNGTGLNGDVSSTHSAIIVPKPEHPNIYFIFTADAQTGPYGLQYSEVNMALDSGLGAVTSNKNILLTTPANEKLTAVKSNTANEFWVIGHKWESNEFVAYNVSNTGVNTTPVISAVGTFIGGSQELASVGQIKISPDGSKLAVARSKGYSEAQLFDFDASTGIISNPLTIFDLPNYESVYGVEFSPNSKVLYIGILGNGIYQYNLDVGSPSEIINSEFVITPNADAYNALQLASNGKIYITKPDQEYIDYIDYPNELGSSCGYQFDALYLNGRIAKRGLPPFIQSFFNVGFQVEDSCIGSDTQFSSNISQSYDTLIWDFGDGTTSTEENPSHLYANPGNYDVSLSVTSGLESSTDSKTITVYEMPTVTPIVELKQCDDDLDGLSIFNLNEAGSEISTNHQNESITFYELQVDAENKNNPIQNSTSYTNALVNSATIWARVENNGDCYQISQLDLVVSSTQIPNTFTREIHQCDNDLDTTDGISIFDFSTVNSEIVALFPEDQELIISYFRNLSEATSQTNPIANISNYENIGYPNTQSIYVRIDNALNDDCFSIEPLITLYVEAGPIANSVSIPQHCNDDGDSMYAFDTSNIETDLLNDQTNITVEYYDEADNALPSPLPNPFITASQDIIARVINSNSQDTVGTCYDETILSFVVADAALANPISDFLQCDDNNDGVFDFNTSNIEAQILDGQTGMIINYFDENGNTLPSPLPNPFTSETQSITIRVENALDANCFDETTLNFMVSEQPVANSIANDFICVDASNNEEHTFNLFNYNTQILEEQSNSTFEVSYFSSDFDALNNSDSLADLYTLNSNFETLYARIQNVNNNNCFDITTFELGVIYLPIANQPENIVICDDESNDGYEIFDLSIQNEAILNGQSIAENNINYYLSFQDAEEGINSQITDFSNTTNPQTIYARIENINSSECFSITSFDIIVQESPNLQMNDLWSICEGGSVQIIADEGYDYYTWSNGQTTRIITIDQPGQYTVTVSNVYENLICSVEKTITVSISNIAIITEIETVDWSQNDNTISVYVEGDGNYEYSLDGTNYQDDNSFSGLNIDEYTVYVRDKNGCGIVSKDVYLMYYPRYFTPNGDGENEEWQIINSVKEPNNKVYVYDRYGKLIYQLKPNDIGWDGTLNGNKLPTNDYWFVLERQNGKTYTGHFTLKR